jgi:four helix bundle protein
LGCSTVSNSSFQQRLNGDLRKSCASGTFCLLQKGQHAMSSTKTYRDLDAWQGAMDLSESVYKLTQVFPDTERYGLISQLRRSSVSIPSNIAEGQARGTAALGLYFLRVAIGSVAEMDTQLEIARRLHFVTTEAAREVDSQLERVRQMLYGMRREHQRRLASAGAKVGSVLLALFAATRLVA